jgi:hypothetical protein
MSESIARPILDLEIRIFREESETTDAGSLSGFSGGPGLYRAELAYGDVREVAVSLGPLPSKQQLSPVPDPIIQGQILFDWLLAPPLLDALQNSRGELTEESGRVVFGSDPKSDPRHVRFRLNLDSRDPELHALTWETLCDRAAGAVPICIETAFSRFLRVRVARPWPISERPLRMLTVLSNPPGLSDFDLSRFDDRFHKQMLANAARPLGPVLEVGSPIYNPTRSDLRELLQVPNRTQFHILHLVAHSVVEGDQAFLLLAGKDGSAEMVPAEAIRDLLRSGSAPALVFLAAPVTQGQPEGAGLLRLAPMLLASGVEAVVVIPGTMQPEKLALFTESFYEVLLRTGTIDRAVAESRKQLFQMIPMSPDWSRPVLYMRTTDGQLFLELSPAFEASIKSVAFGA